MSSPCGCKTTGHEPDCWMLRQTNLVEPPSEAVWRDLPQSRQEGFWFTVDSLTAAVFAADDPNFRFATRGNCERFATAIIHAAKGDVSYPRHNEQERTSPDTPGG